MLSNCNCIFQVGFVMAMISTQPNVHAHDPSTPDVTVARGDSWYKDGQFVGFIHNGLKENVKKHEVVHDQSAKIRTNITQLVTDGVLNGAWVEVSGQCSTSQPDSGWWIGVFPAKNLTIKYQDPTKLAGNNTKSPFTAPFVIPAPLKFTSVNCHQNLSMASGSNVWWVPNVRTPTVFVLMSGGEYGGATEAARTAPLVFSDALRPMHVRLAHTSVPTEMRVSWTSLDSGPAASVRWGTDPCVLNLTNVGIPTGTYSSSDVCGEPAKTMGWWDPHTMFSAVLDLTRLNPVHMMAPDAGTVVYYIVSTPSHSSRPASFTVAGVGAQHTISAVLTADMGATTPDKVSQHWAEADAFATTNLMAELVGNGFGGRAVDLAFNVGDLSYATGYLGKWETFMNQIEAVSSRVPYIAAQGNHEQDWYDTDTIESGTGPELGRDSGGECGVPTATRFIMPSQTRKRSTNPNLNLNLNLNTNTNTNTNTTNTNANTNTNTDVSSIHHTHSGFHDATYWFSFDHGPVHFVIVNTELAFDTILAGQTITQLQWLSYDLTHVDRTVTPWIVLMGHRPMFTGGSTPTLAQLEEVLYAGKVDVTVAGHVHYARQSCPLYKNKCLTPNITGGYDAPIHIVAGNGGQALNNATGTSEQYPYSGSGCDWNKTPSCKTPGATQGSGSEFGMSAFTANATDFTWSFLGNNDSSVHYSFTIHRAYPRPTH